MKNIVTALLLVFALIAFVSGMLQLMSVFCANSKPIEQIRESVDAPPESDRSSRWPTVRNRFVKNNPVCAACGTDDDLNVHHIKPFHSHPELELDTDNLITLCREHHFTVGHDPDGPGPETPNWKLSNPNVKRDSARLRDSLDLAP